MNRFSVASVKPWSVGHQTILVQASWISCFAALTAVGAQVEIPHQPVPYTLQTFFVLLSGALLGRGKGAASQALYLLAGAFGVPVFSGWGFGLAKLMGPTGGYLLSFPVAAFVVAYLIRWEGSYIWSVVSMLVGLFVVFSLGTVQLYVLYYHDWSQAFTNGFLIFSWWDVLKLAGAAAIYHRLTRKAH